MVKCINLLERLYSVKFETHKDKTLLYIRSFPQHFLEITERIEEIARANQKNEKLEVIVLKKSMFSKVLLTEKTTPDSLKNGNDEPLNDIDKILFKLEEFLESDNPYKLIENHKKNKYFPFKNTSYSRIPNLATQGYYLILEGLIYTQRNKNFRQEMYKFKSQNLNEIKKALIKNEERLTLVRKTVFFKNILDS